MLADHRSQRQLWHSQGKNWNPYPRNPSADWKVLLSAWSPATVSCRQPCDLWPQQLHGTDWYASSTGKKAPMYTSLLSLYDWRVEAASAVEDLLYILTSICSLFICCMQIFSFCPNSSEYIHIYKFPTSFCFICVWAFQFIFTSICSSISLNVALLISFFTLIVPLLKFGFLPLFHPCSCLDWAPVFDVSLFCWPFLNF